MPINIDEFLTAHKYYSYKDVLNTLYNGNEDAFLDAWVSGALPLAIRKSCEETMPARTMELALLRRSVRILLEIRDALK